MRVKMLVLAVMFFLSSLVPNSIGLAHEPPNFNSWTVLNFDKKDYNQDGIDDFAYFFLNDKPNPNTASASAFLLFFRRIEANRIDLAIVLHFTRTNEPNKDTILSVCIRFYAHQDGKLVFIEERFLNRPKNVQEPISEPMFEENSSFGRRYFEEWRKLGAVDDKIRQYIPKWGWLPE